MQEYHLRACVQINPRRMHEGYGSHSVFTIFLLKIWHENNITLALPNF